MSWILSLKHKNKDIYKPQEAWSGDIVIADKIDNFKNEETAFLVIYDGWSHSYLLEIKEPVPMLMTNNGNPFTFNYKLNARLNFNGKVYGLKNVIRSGEYEYLNLQNDGNKKFKIK